MNPARLKIVRRMIGQLLLFVVVVKGQGTALDEIYHVTLTIDCTAFPFVQFKSRVGFPEQAYQSALVKGIAAICAQGDFPARIA